MARVLLAGYFGEGNVGDDAMLAGMGDMLQARNHSISVLSGAPEETFRYYGYRGYFRKDNKAIQSALEEADALVFAGGSIFQDVTSVMSVSYYQGLVSKAKKMGKKVALVGQGIGPLNSFLGKRMAVTAFNAADVLAVRDPGSVDTLRALGVNRKVHLTADPAFLLDTHGGQDDDSDNFQVGGMQTVGLAPRPWGKGKEVHDLFGDLARRLFEARLLPVLIEMDKKEDGPLIQEISKSQGGKIPDLRKLATPMQIQKRIARMRGVISMRLHAGLLSAAAGIPPLMVSYDPKVTAFARLLDSGPALPFEGLTGQRAFDKYMEADKDRERNQKVIAKKIEELRKLAMQNVELVDEMIRPKAGV